MWLQKNARRCLRGYRKKGLRCPWIQLNGMTTVPLAMCAFLASNVRILLMKTKTKRHLSLERICKSSFPNKMLLTTNILAVYLRWRCSIP